jgi:hypothetical protein
LSEFRDKISFSSNPGSAISFGDLLTYSEMKITLPINGLINLIFSKWHGSCGYWWQSLTRAAVKWVLAAAKHHRGGHLMVDFKKLAIPVVAGMLLLGGLAACDREGPMERAGEKVDRSVERAGDKVERATDK